ncbi:MAG: hypothetical protein P8Y38_05165, partial [Deltaproteobacteria bacterium]
MKVLKPLLEKPAASSGEHRTTPERKPNTMKELISNIAKALVDQFFHGIRLSCWCCSVFPAARSRCFEKWFQN